MEFEKNILFFLNSQPLKIMQKPINDDEQNSEEDFSEVLHLSNIYI